MPKVSVIIPSYNHAAYLQQRIDSILRQTVDDMEIIILDDHSTDNSIPIIESYRDNSKVVRILYNQQNSGSPFKQWKKGIEYAKGTWIWIAESDDYSEPLFLETLLDLAATKDNIGIAFSNSYWVDDKGNKGEDLSIYESSFHKSGIEEVKIVLSRYCSIQNVSSCIIRRDVASKFIDGLGKYKACGDWIFYARALQHSDLLYTGYKLNYFRWYHNNTSNSADKTGLWVSEGINVLTAINYK